MTYDLLTLDEARKLPLWVRACGEGWWTKTPGKFDNTMSVVFDDGQVQEFGPEPTARFGVRVVIDFEDRDDYDLMWGVGDVIREGSDTLYYLGNNRWLTLNLFGRHRFGETVSWQDSELKAWLDEYEKGEGNDV